MLYCFIDINLCDVFYSPDFEVNFMDDVGQTLLNWASAFGTQEMVSHIISSDIYF